MPGATLSGDERYVSNFFTCLIQTLTFKCRNNKRQVKICLFKCGPERNRTVIRGTGNLRFIH
jgi:hypothetical protein